MTVLHHNKQVEFKLPSAVPRGFLKYYVLRLLSRKPMHGYEIMNEIEKKSNGVWRPSAGSIYPILMRLEDRKLIKAISHKSKVERKRPYQITEKGKDYLKECMDRVGRISKRIDFLATFWRDLLYPRERFKTALQNLETNLSHLKESINHVSSKVLERNWPVIENMKEVMEGISNEIDDKTEKKKR